jgi:hypothetical protein
MCNGLSKIFWLRDLKYLDAYFLSRICGNFREMWYSIHEYKNMYLYNIYVMIVKRG